jgi:2-dehydro-3-deoxy-L-rhamnonate dehydrogenase (NAD+)
MEAGMSAGRGNQVAVVTGGSQGLGLAIATRLLRDGIAVSLWDCEEPALARATQTLAAGERVFSVAVDVAQEEQVSAAAQQTLRRFGSVSILVNNAGIAGPYRSAWHLALAEWQHIIDVNLTGVFLCCRALIPQMLTAGYGRIVNIASIAGKEGSPSIAGYAASKAGVIGLTKTLGRELAHTEIRVNCVAPAAIRTAIFDAWPPEFVKSLVAKIPLGRFGTPEELAAMVAWLVSAEASFTTGAVFDLSGGRADY